MLHEAFYPSELSDNHPIRIFYGFVQEGYKTDYQVTLVVFYPALYGTATTNLSEENKAGLVNFLLTKHMFGVGAKYVKVAFMTRHLVPGEFYGEGWSIDVFQNMATKFFADKRQKNLEKYGFFGRLINRTTQFEVRIDGRHLTVGSTDTIRLIDEHNLSFERTRFLLEQLKITDFGDYKEFYGEGYGLQQ